VMVIEEPAVGQHERFLDDAALLDPTARTGKEEDETVVGRGALEEPVQPSIDAFFRRLVVLQDADVVETVNGFQRGAECFGISRAVGKIVGRPVAADTNGQRLLRHLTPPCVINVSPRRARPSWRRDLLIAEPLAFPKAGVKQANAVRATGPSKMPRFLTSPASRLARVDNRCRTCRENFQRGRLGTRTDERTLTSVVMTRPSSSWSASSPSVSPWCH